MATRRAMAIATATSAVGGGADADVDAARRASAKAAPNSPATPWPNTRSRMKTTRPATSKILSQLHKAAVLKRPTLPVKPASKATSAGVAGAVAAAVAATGTDATAMRRPRATRQASTT